MACMRKPADDATAEVTAFLIERAGDPKPLAYTVAQFCRLHRISRSTYYALQKAGAGPRVMRVRGSVRISWEAAAEWRRRMELD